MVLEPDLPPGQSIVVFTPIEKSLPRKLRTPGEQAGSAVGEIPGVKCQRPQIAWKRVLGVEFKQTEQTGARLGLVGE